MKPLRSLLYVPGNRRDLMDKAPGYGADAVALVLEDSVPESQRVNARRIVARQLSIYGDSKTEVFVKVNDYHSGGMDHDLPAVMSDHLRGLIVPKVNSREEINAIDESIADAEEHAGLQPGAIDVLLLIETPSAVLHVGEFASASPRIRTLICGAAEGGDLAGSLGITWTAEGTERIPILSQVNVAARAAGKTPPIDGVWTRIGDLDGLESDARLARRLGFEAKLAVHPEQIPIIHRVFSPSLEEVERQKEILREFESALAEGSASIVVGGQFIDYAMADTARRVIALSKAYEEEEEEVQDAEENLEP